MTSTVEARADVTVTKNANPDPIAAGQNLTYLVTASNGGPSRADNVTITDTLPLNVSFVSAAPSAGSCGTTPGSNATTTAGNRTVICNLGNIANGAQQTVAILVRPNTATRGTTLTNNVSVATDTVETNAGNNTAAANASVIAPALDLVHQQDGLGQPGRRRRQHGVHHHGHQLRAFGGGKRHRDRHPAGHAAVVPVRYQQQRLLPDPACPQHHWRHGDLQPRLHTQQQRQNHHPDDEGRSQGRRHQYGNRQLRRNRPRLRGRRQQHRE